jgi:putative SOS response-associated peptidase YedK
MCGRYTLTSPDELVEEFGLGELPFDLKPRYNIAPTQESPVIIHDEGPQLRLYRWGLVPSWARDTKSASRMINARSESVHEKPAFREAFKRRRCLVCCDGFYEWKREGKSRLPHFMHRKDSRPFAMAGIWESWGPDTHTFAVLTTDANEMMQPIHHRMPVLISHDDYERWLDPKPAARADLEDLLHPPAVDELELFQVSELVNKVSNDSPACLRRGPDQQKLF